MLAKIGESNSPPLNMFRKLESCPPALSLSLKHIHLLRFYIHQMLASHLMDKYFTLSMQVKEPHILFTCIFFAGKKEHSIQFYFRLPAKRLTKFICVQCRSLKRLLTWNLSRGKHDLSFSITIEDFSIGWWSLRSLIVV